MNQRIDIRDACIESLIGMAAAEPRIVVLDADVSKSTRMRLFGREYPGRFLNVGAAEMNMAGIAAGLAATGMIPFISSFAVFLALRACEPIRTLISYPRANVKMLAGYAGLTANQHGPTHQCLEDIAVMRAMPNMTIVSPSDAVSASSLVEEAAGYPGPVYLRLGYDSQEPLRKAEELVEIGRAYVLRAGTDVAILATGLVCRNALKAAERLEQKGISAMVVDCPTIKPFPDRQMMEIIGGIPKIVTVEEHNIVGGFGSAVAEFLVRSRLHRELRILGVGDSFAESAPYDDLLERYGLGVQAIVRGVESALAGD